MSVWLLLILSALCGFSAVNGQICIEGQIMLVQTGSIDLANAGRVEICLGGVWGTIAVDSLGLPWSEKNAQVACIELGFSGALNSIFQRTIPFSDRPPSSSPTNIINVACTGTESSIINCPHSTTIPQDIDHLFDAYIVCRPGEGMSYSTLHSGGPRSGDIRLFGDARNGYGAVSIYSSTLGWLAICPDNSWTNTDATQICRELGYQGGSITRPIRPLSGPGGNLPSRQLYAANCPASSGGDSISRVTIGVCSFGIQPSASSCTASEGMLAAVACSSVSDNSVRLIGGEDSREGIVQIAYNGRWGVVCSDSFSTTDAGAVCRGLGFGDGDARTRTASSSMLQSVSSLQPIWLTGLDCTASDRSLSACVREDDIIGYANCPGSIAGVDCGDPPLSAGAIAGIVIGALLGVGILIAFIYFLDVKNRQKAAKAYNDCLGRIKSIECPSCACTCPSPPHRTPPTSPQPAATPPPATASQPGPSQPPPPPASAPAPAAAPVVAPGPQQPPPEPEPSGQESGFTKVPPPSYQAAPGFPSQNAPFDAPPPYPGGPVGFVYAPTSAPGAAAYPPPTQGFPPNTAPYPPT